MVLARRENSAGMVNVREVNAALKLELRAKGAVRVMVILEAELTTI